MRRLPNRGDAGVSLIFVLLFLMLVSAVALGLLGFTEASFTEGQDIRTIRNQNYAADAAIELGIYRARKMASVGSVGHPCSYTLSGINGYSATVACDAATTTSGTAGGGRALNAVLTLTGPLEVAGTDQLTVRGDVYAHGTITTSSSSNSMLTVEGAVVAPADNTVCSNTRITYTKGCTAVATSAGNQPAWSSTAIASTTSTPGSIDTCSNGANGVVVFKPGKYTANNSPATLIAAKTGCNNPSIMSFPGGTYYFEDFLFDTGSYDVNVGARTSAGVCSAGAQIILGGTAAFVVPKGSGSKGTTTVSMCGLASGDSPPIALYGVPSSAPTGYKTQTGQTVGGRTGIGFKAGDGTGGEPHILVDSGIFLPTTTAWIQVFGTRVEVRYAGGFVVGSLVAEVSANNTLLGDPISIPTCAEVACAVNDRSVAFIASLPGQTWTRAVVDFTDGNGLTPGATANVSSWSVRR